MSCLGQTTNGHQCRRTIGLVNGRCRTHGDGVVSAIKQRVKSVWEGPSNRASDRLQKFLSDHRNRHVVRAKLGRTPVLKPVDVALNVISAGKYKQKQKELNYDDVYHNYLLVQLDNGVWWKLEKNERVVFAKPTKTDFDNVIADMPLRKETTLPEMFERASKGKEKEFYRYRAGSNNCQEFTRDMIEKNGLLDAGDDRIKLQDSKQLIDTLPGGELIPNTVTDLANIIDRVRHGDGRPRKFMCPL